MQKQICLYEAGHDNFIEVGHGACLIVVKHPVLGFVDHSYPESWSFVRTSEVLSKEENGDFETKNTLYQRVPYGYLTASLKASD